jgi:dextranase
MAALKPTDINGLLRRAAVILLIAPFPAYCASTLQITEITFDKARYAPGEIARLDISIDNRAEAERSGLVTVTLEDRGRVVTSKEVRVRIRSKAWQTVNVAFRAPRPDFQGYRVEVHLRDLQGRQLAEACSALDVSSNWSRFPRYGYVSHFGEDVPVAQWMTQLNRYHINGLQFYDVLYEHHLPLKPGNPSEWSDVANRVIHRNIVDALLESAKRHNMTSMVYNASYAAFADAFTDGSGVQLQWAAWPDAMSPRTADNVKSFPLPKGWATSRLLYMNQQSGAWRKYLFARMAELFQVFPYDGWQIDTYGDAGAWDWNGKPIDYTAGFPGFANAARDALQRKVVLNTVSGAGAVAMAGSDADFVYSELWPEDHATYGSISTFADEIHEAHPGRAIVFAAYLHSALAAKLREHGSRTVFNAPGVLLADAVIFSSGAAHIELGDGDRMLSRPYFPDDTAITISYELRRQLLSYYDFQVAYENYLRGDVVRDDFPVRLDGVRQTETAQPGAVWVIKRKNARCSMLHLINFSGMKSDQWQDDEANYSVPPALHDIGVHVELAGALTAGWVSPDVDGGQWHPMTLRRASKESWDITIPVLHYWTMIIIC